MAIRILTFLLLLTALPLAGQAQKSSPATAMTDVQKQGELAFRQRCQVCHVQPLIGNSKYGPRLSKEFVIGREAFVRKQIADGSEHMPGFKYGLRPEQIDAIIEYLKTADRSQVEDNRKRPSNESTDQDN